MRRPFIHVTGIKIGKYSIPVPNGFSELLHKANAWSLDNTEITKTQGYQREIVLKDGKLRTILTKINK